MSYTHQWRKALEKFCIRKGISKDLSEQELIEIRQKEMQKQIDDEYFEAVWNEVLKKEVK